MNQSGDINRAKYSNPSVENFHFASCFYVRLILVPTILCLGCAPPRPPLGRVFGTVTYQGEPFSEAELLFSKVSGGVNVTIELDSGGSYEVRTAGQQGLPPGEYRVALRTPKIEAPVGESLSRVPPRKHPKIPPHYRRLETSNLTVTVTDGENQLDIDLEP